MEGEKTRGRPRMKLLDLMMKEGYSKLKERPRELDIMANGVFRYKKALVIFNKFHFVNLKL